MLVVLSLFLLLCHQVSADMVDEDECNRHISDNIDGIKRVVTHELFRQQESKGCVPAITLTDYGFDEMRVCRMHDIVFTSDCECDFDVQVGSTSVFDKTDVGNNAWLVKNVVTGKGMGDCKTRINVIEGQKGYIKDYTCRLGHWMFMKSHCKCSFIASPNSPCELANRFRPIHVELLARYTDCPKSLAAVAGSDYIRSLFQIPFDPFVDDSLLEEDEDEEDEE